MPEKKFLTLLKIRVEYKNNLIIAEVVLKTTRKNQLFFAKAKSGRSELI
jgi:hypothetical protein